MGEYYSCYKCSSERTTRRGCASIVSPRAGHIGCVLWLNLLSVVQSWDSLRHVHNVQCGQAAYNKWVKGFAHRDILAVEFLCTRNLVAEQIQTGPWNVS